MDPIILPSAIPHRAIPFYAPLHVPPVESNVDFPRTPVMHILRRLTFPWLVNATRR